MSFPDYKRNILGFKRPDGWEELGEVEAVQKFVNDHWELVEERHTFCKTKTHVGKENGKLFWYCPRCMIELQQKKD